ncbi:MAG: FAD:protein transferase [Gaiellales bacterium]|nr:FAD:protein transferase [Gaiellales bacterium]
MITHVEHVMGTAVSITVDPGSGSPAAAIADACAVLQTADETFSTFKAGSALSRHRRGELRAEELPADLLVVLELSARAARLTGGYFDPWAMPGGVDPTGLVKGWAAQRALGRLRDGRMAAAMVNAGGDIACFGPQPWRIGVRDPGDAERLVCVAEVTDAIATSGGYERPGELIDPRDRLPAARLAQATVVGEDLALADAYATALVVRGDHGLAMVEGTPYEAVIVTHDGRMLATPDFPIAAPHPERHAA